MKLFTGLFAAGLLFMMGCKKDEAVTTTVTVTTATISGITTTSATGGGSLAVSGNVAVTERGVCWATTHDPTTANSKTSDGSGTGSFTSNLSGLIARTVYYVRAYAINAGTTYYGDEVTFTAGSPTRKELIVNGDFSTPAGGDYLLSTAVPWKTDETDATIIGRDPGTYKGQTGYIWTFDLAKSFYQTVGVVPPVETEYDVSFDGTCTWTDWGGYAPEIAVSLSAYDGNDPSTRTLIDSVQITDPVAFPGWDLNTWGNVTGKLTLTAAQATAAAGKKLVIEFAPVHYLVSGSNTNIYYNFDNISVIGVAE